MLMNISEGGQCISSLSNPWSVKLNLYKIITIGYCALCEHVLCGVRDAAVSIQSPLSSYRTISPSRKRVLCFSPTLLADMPPSDSEKPRYSDPRALGTVMCYSFP